MELFLGLSFLAVIGFVVFSAVKGFDREEVIESVYYHARTDSLVIGKYDSGLFTYSYYSYNEDGNLGREDLIELLLIGEL